MTTIREERQQDRLQYLTDKYRYEFTAEDVADILDDHLGSDKGRATIELLGKIAVSYGQKRTDLTVEFFGLINDILDEKAEGMAEFEVGL